MIIPVSLKVRIEASRIISQENLRCSSAETSAPNTPTAAASVGVVTPAMIEPRVTTTMMMGRITARRASIFSRQEARSSLGRAGARCGWK